MILLIDNYDSFTYNLEQYLRELEAETAVYRNDALTCPEIEKMNPEAIVISPGPGRPSHAGISVETVKKFSGKIPILGVCLGHQAIAEAFGGKIIRAGKIMHGKTSEITNDAKGIFSGFKKPFRAMRYHSLVVDRDSLPEELVITAESEDGEIMGLRHRSHFTEGVQFHPESIMSPHGKRMLRNFINQAKLLTDKDGGAGRFAEALI
ncbi:anthranilate synthase component II [Sedimentisphaera salicampi]|uniref:Para-aminobenzoate synthase glutamine amidotransferase component II n=1 Tax=Sedimentisphaera salicampi TaxID=1941349 RepID=A0A1W6LKW9_9BACT|nr:aminodeoxychorismate/anthranilate synthase component II [Sedimentisphaera salicampi]ARN56374.1 Para-aminobenzoate synthase glutamine amidotransferase component II [Sedimentisphaera salicampi]OXU15260.1 Para-aminobenzoate synthase glutamine amidotransferase component II [Sedimentisphaera salicampi]